MSKGTSNTDCWFLLVLGSAFFPHYATRHCLAIQIANARTAKEEVNAVSMGGFEQPARLRVFVQKWREVRGHNVPTGSSRSLFPGSSPGIPMAPKSLASILRRAAWRAGLTKRVRPHVLRHSFATEFLEDGVDLPTIQQLLRHNSIRTSARYVRVSAKHIQGITSPAEKIRIPGIERTP